ncbi:MAG TPA: hypothetical protein DDZ76_15435 [Xanthomonadales bacterium]|nr:hypothetical protein [Xanthomonadales bacterium]
MKPSTIALSLVLLLGGALYLFRAPVFDLMAAWLTADMFIDTIPDGDHPGVAIGEPFPAIRATLLRPGEDSDDTVLTDIRDLLGERGVLLVANRSVAWCPYCMRQLVQLQEHKAAFDAAGIALVGLTYDPPAEHRAFMTRHGIEFAMLADHDAYSVKALGILNADYAPGDEHYGIPDPGMFVIDRQGRIVGKVFVKGYATRVDATTVLEHARAALAGP